tara:strand:- start:402 stop:578 length:177 start_codon:yes stop_codon:yes gene_type:complete
MSKIHQVKVYDGAGNIKYIISEEDCSKKHWDDFYQSTIDGVFSLTPRKPKKIKKEPIE